MEIFYEYSYYTLLGCNSHTAPTTTITTATTTTTVGVTVAAPRIGGGSDGIAWVNGSNVTGKQHSS